MAEPENYLTQHGFVIPVSKPKTDRIVVPDDWVNQFISELTQVFNNPHINNSLDLIKTKHLKYQFGKALKQVLIPIYQKLISMKNVDANMRLQSNLLKAWRLAVKAGMAEYRVYTIACIKNGASHNSFISIDKILSIKCLLVCVTE